MADVSLFKNGYGVSIICSEYSYGLELAVLEWEGTWDDEKDAPKEVKTYNITYNTPITDDVVGHLNADTLKETVDKVKALEGEL
ncbi:MAG: hypothetical protein Tp152DCM46671_1 [Prokaryotic dsDNA virus sp.]|nr:MAG: hypothetical protein Tp152DCM46671_1 [Prokaryotic dsDNA virus sp.]|tara:strand:+ start:549 stop:800 length:252 start_codon:yes stop_codon:yes gene_type:complete